MASRLKTFSIVFTEYPTNATHQMVVEASNAIVVEALAEATTCKLPTRIVFDYGLDKEVETLWGSLVEEMPCVNS